MGCGKTVDRGFKNVRLLVDIDYKPSIEQKFAEEIAKKMNFIDFTFGTVFTRVKCFETGRGLHLIFDVIAHEDFSDMDIIVCQLALGSDYKRELFNYRRIKGKTKVKDWNILFKKKVKRDADGNIVYVSEERETEFAKRIAQMIMEEYLKLTLGNIPEIRKDIKEEELREMKKSLDVDMKDLLRFML